MNLYEITLKKDGKNDIRTKVLKKTSPMTTIFYSLKT